MTGPVSLVPVAPARRRFARYAWGVLAFNLGVILWGAVVRATGSGAGCGSNWPSCDGAAVPALEDSETLIEFVHRATSGLAVVAVLALAVWAFRLFPPGDLLRRAAAVAGAVIVVEALIGAALVLFGWVEDDASLGRVIAIAVHQANTLVLIGVLTLTAWWSSGGALPVRPLPRLPARLFGWAFAGLVVVGALGAITALGDTLFPAESLADGLRAETSAQARWLIRLRVIHPVLAVALGGYLIWLVRRLGDVDRNVTAFGLAVVVLVGTQLLAGFVNVALLAPLWMQLVHLLLADLLMVAVVLLGASAAATRAAAPAEIAK